MVDETSVRKACQAICRSGKFETGEGTCAALCMEFLGSPRDGPNACPHCVRIHGDFARRILEAVCWSA